MTFKIRRIFIDQCQLHQFILKYYLNDFTLHRDRDVDEHVKENNCKFISSRLEAALSGEF